MSVLIDELKRQRAAALTSAKDIKETAKKQERSLSEDELSRYNGFMREFDRLTIEITQEQELADAQAVLDQPEPRAIKPDQPGERMPRQSRVEVMHRFQSLRAFKTPEAAYASGQWFRGLLGVDSAREWCLTRGMEYRAGSEGVGTKGGFTVPDDFDAAVVDLRERFGAARQVCRIYPMPSDHTFRPRKDSGLVSYYVGEGAAPTESEQAWSQIELTAKKLGILTRISNELSEDSIINLAQDIAEDCAREFAEEEDAALILGDGSPTYGGMTGLKTIFDAGVGVLTGAVDPLAGVDTFAEITHASLTKALGVLPSYAHPGAAWLCSSVCKAVVFDRLAMAMGAATVTDMQGNVRPAYLGLPIVICHKCPTSVGVINNTPFLYLGDFRLGSTMGVRKGIEVAVSKDAYFTTDQTGFRAIERYHIVNHDTGSATAAGPIVALMGNT